MKVGDLILRKAKPFEAWCKLMNKKNGIGLVLARNPATDGKGMNMILTVYYSKSNTVATIGEALVETAI